MKRNLLFISALMLIATGCSNNDYSERKEPTKEEGTNFVGGTEVVPKSRTSLQINGSQVKYFWEPGDKIWTADAESSSPSIPSSSPTATFKFPKRYSGSTVDVYYTGSNGYSYNQVNIQSNQVQREPNKTDHLGRSGDCGTATATRQSDGSYKFNLDHKASYLYFLPTTSSNLISTYIQEIKVISDNNIAGSYTLKKTGLTGSGSSNEITLRTGGSGSYSYGFSLKSATMKPEDNAAYMVIAPGTHTLTIEYTLHDKDAGTTVKMKKKINSMNYAANTVYPINSNFSCPDYSERKHYMWDADENYDYWYGHESDQPTIPSQSASGYAVSNTDSRWYNEVNVPYSGGVVATRSCAKCPSNNEMSWYMNRGDVHADTESPWTFKGRLYCQGLWILKKQYIPGFTDATALSFYNSANPYVQGRPSDAVINKYFYVPTLGRYDNGYWSWGIGSAGVYWTKSPKSGNNRADYLLFDMSHWDIGIDGRRTYGCQAISFE